GGGSGSGLCELSAPVDVFVSLSPLEQPGEVSLSLAARAGGALAAAAMVPEADYPDQAIRVARLSPEGAVSGTNSLASGGALRSPAAAAFGDGYRVFFSGLGDESDTLDLHARNVSAAGSPLGAAVALT